MKRKTYIPKRLPKPASLDPSEREYLRLLLKYQRAYEAEMRAALKGQIPDLREIAGAEMPQEIRMDAQFANCELKNTPNAVSHRDSYPKWGIPHFDANIPKVLAAVFDLVSARMRSRFPDSLLARWALGMVGNVNRTAKQNTQKVAKAVDIEVEPLLRDGELTPYFQNVIDENVALIRSIPEEKMPAFRNALVNAITQDLPAKAISGIIQKNFKTTKSKARLLARDQVGKLNGKLNRYRQQQIGGKRYTWRTSEDERVRPDHARLDGKTFSWDSPPITDRKSGRRGNPGDDYQCRCHAEMVLEDIVK